VDEKIEQSINVEAGFWEPVDAARVRARSTHR
jgi:hypothetical protein